MENSHDRPRVPFVSVDTDDTQVSVAFDRLRQRWQGAPVLHLYRLLGHAPGLIGPWLDFASALRFRVSAPTSLRELLIVRSGQSLGAAYEWQHHWVLALEAGVPEEKLHALERWIDDPLFNDEERAVLALADETSTGAGASAATISRLTQYFDNQSVVEFVITAGFYAGVSRIINSLAVPIEDDFHLMSPKDS